MEALKAGYVSFGTMYYEPANLMKFTARAEKELTAAGIELVRTDPVTGEGKEPERAVRELKRDEWDVLILNVMNWIDVRGVTRVIQAFKDRPMILYSYGGFTDENGVLIAPAAGAGTTALRYPMELWGIKFKYLFNAPDSRMDTEGILSFGRACRAARKLKHTRLGMIGFNDMGLVSTGFNTTQLLDRIGPEVESMDMLQLERRMEKLTDGEVKKAVSEITRDWEYPLGKPAPEVIERSIRLYLATMALCREKNFAGFSYKCVDGVDLEMGATHAVPSALIASSGIPYVDENDIGNLCAEMMLKYLSGKSVGFLEHYEHHPEWILLGEDGYVPGDFIDGKPQIKPVATVLLGGIAHCSRMKTGQLTCCCLSEDGAGYRMHIVRGEGKEPPKWVEMGVPLPPWPSVKFFPEVPVRQILDHVQSQHFAYTFGDYVDELVDLCYLLDIKAVVDC